MFVAHEVTWADASLQMSVLAGFVTDRKSVHCCWPQVKFVVTE